MERNNTATDEVMLQQLDAIWEADDAALEVMLASGHIDAITDNLFNRRVVQETLKEFRDDGLTKEDVWERVVEYQENLNDILATAAIGEDDDSPRIRVLRRLLEPGVEFLREVYDKYLEGDCLLKVELMVDDEGQVTAKLPTRAHETDAGMDIYAFEEAVIPPGDICAVRTGLKVAIPTGWQLSIRPRSGLSLKDLTIVNSPGTIDSLYHEEIKVLIKNNGTKLYTINQGDRIAQFVLEKVYLPKWEVVDNLKEHIEASRANEKGEQGFGSTGR